MVVGLLLVASAGCRSGGEPAVGEPAGAGVAASPAASSASSETAFPRVGVWHRFGTEHGAPARLAITEVSPEGFRFELSSSRGGHTGEVAGRAALKDGRFVYTSTEVKASLSFEPLGGGLRLTSTGDMGYYGGVGVTFDGEFREGEGKDDSSLVSLGVLPDAAMEEEFRRLAGDRYPEFILVMVQISEGTDLDGLGAKVSKGGVPGLFTIMEGIVMHTPDRGLWAAVLDAEDGKIHYYTNRDVSKEPPKTIREWMNRFPKKAVVKEGGAPAAKEQAPSPEGLIPAGWRVLEGVHGEPGMVRGDLNQDGIEDAAAVIVGPSSGPQAAPRALIAAFGQPDGTYRLQVRAERAVLLADEGGAFGDPFSGLSINRGSILLQYYGGAGWRWYGTYRFRYQDGGFMLIGATTGSYNAGSTLPEDADETDCNLLTGDCIVKKTNDQGKRETVRTNRGVQKLLPLTEFDPRTYKAEGG